MRDMYSQLMATMTPEEIEQLLGLSTAEDENAMLQAQLAQAQELARGSGNRYQTAGGAFLGGAGDLLQAIAGHRDQKALRAKQAELISRQGAGRKQLGQSIYNAMRQPGPSPDGSPTVPQMMKLFGF